MSTWVLLRGLGREQAHWGEVPALLRARLPEGDVLTAVDLPGNGARWREASPWTVRGMLASVHAELRGRGCAPPFLPVALSLGAMVAMQWAADAPGELRGCVLINSSAGALGPWWDRLRPACYRALLQGVWARSARARERAILTATSNRPVDEGVLEAWTRIAQEHPVRAANILRQLAAATRFRAPHRLGVPALVLASRGDRMVAHRCSEALALQWGVPLREHADAGHDLPLDDPHWVVAAIADWAGAGVTVTNPP